MNRRLLCQGVRKVAQKEVLSLKQAVQFRYPPALTAPVADGDDEELPDCVMDILFIEQWGGGGDSVGRFLCTGGANGVVRSLGRTEDFRSVMPTKVHTGPIKCISSLSYKESKSRNAVVASGSMDQILMMHTLDEKTKVLRPHGFYKGRHFRSLSGVELLCRSDGGVVIVGCASRVYL